MLSNTKLIVVGVSGGADSIALLHFTKNLCCENGIKLIAAHINHGIRGKEAERDENFVKKTCLKWGIELFVKRENINELSKKMGLGLEECGRKVRYNYFLELCKGENSKIATAHTLSDSIETVLLNITRGCGLKGLCGIPPVRGKIIRPFIEVSRSEIEEYCEENSLSFVNDSTNFTCDYTRNKIRHKVIPCLKEINPALEASFSRLISSISEDYAHLNFIAKKTFNSLKSENGFTVEKIKNLSGPIKKRVLLEILKYFGLNSPEYKDIELLEKLINGEINCFSFSKAYNIVIKNGILNISPVKNKKKEPVLWEYKAGRTNILTEVKKTFIIDILNSKEDIDKVLKDRNLFKNSINLEIIEKKSLVFRNRRSGDYFCPLRRGLTKKLKKFFNEIKIPLEKRDSLPILSLGKDLVWIESIGVSEKYKIDENTKLIGLISERQDS